MGREAQSIHHFKSRSMFHIKSHTGIEKRKPDFYILNKGMNAGRPLLEPCPNCFEVFLNKKEEKDHLYWLIFGLWKTKRFEHSLMGSVIPYIRKKELEDIVHQGIQSLSKNQSNINRTVEKIKKVDQLHKHLELQIAKLTELKFALMHEVLK